MASARTLSIVALGGVPEVKAGDNLVELTLAALRDNSIELRDDDVLVLAQKIVSKAEGRLVRLSTVEVTAAAAALAQVTGKDPRLMELMLRESREVLRAKADVIVVEHRLGFVMANAGIDQSNVPGGDEAALLLPESPQRTCEEVRAGIARTIRVDCGVVINDSFGRAWRNGVTGVALGVAGIPALANLCGQTDRFGRPLRITQVAVADEVAAAASLMMGQAGEGCPIVHLRGVPYGRSSGNVGALLRDKAEDMFR